MYIGDDLHPRNVILQSVTKRSQRCEWSLCSLAVPDTSISTVASSPLATLISRLPSPNDAEYDDVAEDP